MYNLKIAFSFFYLIFIKKKEGMRKENQ